MEAEQLDKGLPHDLECTVHVPVLDSSGAGSAMVKVTSSVGGSGVIWKETKTFYSMHMWYQKYTSQNMIILYSNMYLQFIIVYLTDLILLI